MRRIGLLCGLIVAAAVLTCGVACAQNAGGASPDASAAPPAASASGASTVTPAKLTHSVAPDYQPAAGESSPSGTVVVKYKIQADGTVSDVEFVSGPEELKDSAIAAVKQWTYEPARVSGHAVPSSATANLVFKPSPPSSSDANAAAPPANSAASANATASLPAAVAPPSPGVPTPDKPLRVGGNIAARNLVSQVQPVYPQRAKYDHVEGTVVLHVLIAKDGTVKNVAYVSGPEELKDTSIEAVKQWRYKPTTLNGKPFEVDTTVAVVYTMH
jgi:TonB family protein